MVQNFTIKKKTLIALRILILVTNAPGICIHCPTPRLRGWAGDSGANVQGSDLFSYPAVPGSAGLVILRENTPVKFTIIKSRAMTLSRSPQCRAFSRALMDERWGGGGGGGSGYK